MGQFFEKTAENGLEKREGQIAMFSEGCDAVVNKKPIAVEAGIGIGKSIAYLVPINLQYFRERRQIIIATSTIAFRKASMEKIRPMYERFKGWAEEFKLASVEQRKMIISNVVSRIELGKGYKLKITLNMEYEQFCEGWNGLRKKET